jgi:hypothetical protein
MKFKYYSPLIYLFSNANWSIKNMKDIKIVKQKLHYSLSNMSINNI